MFIRYLFLFLHMEYAGIILQGKENLVHPV